jgi:hypothetical protein
MGHGAQHVGWGRSVHGLTCFVNKTKKEKLEKKWPGTPWERVSGRDLF